MYHHSKRINHVLILRRSRDKNSTDTTCCVTDGDPWSAKLEIEAKEDHQLSKLHGIFVAKLVEMKRKQIQERALRFISNDFTSTLETLLILNNGAAIHISKMKPIASEVFQKNK